MRFLKIYILGFLLFTTQTLLAQIEFTTAVSKNKLGVNQRFKVQFSVNKQGADNFKPPAFTNFKVLAGPSSSVNQSWINGKTTYTQSYIYIVQPTKVGEFTIQPASIEYDGKIETSNPIKITVTKAVEIPKDPNNPLYVAQQNIHLVAEISNTKPYVGEGIYVVYKLYVSENISVHDFRVTESPQYNGFWNQDIDVKDSNVRKGKYNGEDYRYLILKRAVLIPQRNGKLKIEPIKMDFSVGIPTGRGDFFGNPITHNINYSAQSSLKSVNVKALPEEGKPIDFTGAVGEFDFKVVANKNVLKANDAATIKVEVSGKGNLKLFEIPKITTPSELEVYTPEHKERVSTSLSGLRGSISDSYTVVPQYKGKYKIPKVSFTYFNPKEKKYNTITSEDMYVNVTEGKELPNAAVTNTDNDETTNVNKQVVVAKDNNFRFIALDTTLQPKENSVFFKTKSFYLLLLLPFLVIPIGIFIGRKNAERAGDVFGNRIRKADKLAKKYLSQAKKQLGNQEQFYIALEKALHNFLKAKLLVETSDISKEKISEILRDKGVETTTIKEFIDVLNDCDFARYTPTTNVMMEQEFEKAKEVITKIDKHL
ncbi:Oxygen tolerance [Lutibacter oricola]|uniref:Oxygen tolerance n=1 Tax=Lutibacter oricola TaxID=762486 RepID=A0A1H3D3F4_9FLAO|nr:BatD family protein [Lutibacter oricola]SDX60993.1 Oxygen tolerance [Lutibacter oricola]